MLDERASACLPHVRQYSVCDFTLVAFSKETALISNDFNIESNVSEKTLLCQHLEASAKSLTTLHLHHVDRLRKEASWDRKLEASIEQDFILLVNSSC